MVIYIDRSVVNQSPISWNLHRSNLKCRYNTGQPEPSGNASNCARINFYIFPRPRTREAYSVTTKTKFFGSIRSTCVRSFSLVKPHDKRNKAVINDQSIVPHASTKT